MNDEQLKQKVFALYWGQKVCEYSFNEMNKKCFVNTRNLLRSEELIDNWCLYLTPLSDITDEDALATYRYYYPPEDFRISSKEEQAFYDTKVALDWLRNYGSPNYITITIDGADFLRSRGYALPAFEHSVEELVEKGIFKLV